MIRSDHSAAPLWRERLIDLFRQATKKPVIYVEAGGGYSKTTTVQQYISTTGAQCITIPLKQLHNVSEVFWQALLENVHRIDENSAKLLVRIGMPTQGGSYMAFLQCIRQLVLNNGPVYVFLDDFHMMEETWIIDLLCALATEEIPGLHIIITSRYSCPALQEDLAGKQLLATIGASELAFTFEEMCQFLAPRIDSNDHALPVYIMEKTEGWPLATHLLYCTLSENKPVAHSLEEIRPAVYSLMGNELFSKYPRALKRSLVYLSLLEILYPEMLATLTGVDLPAIDSLIPQNPFISRDANGLYVIHNMYQGFLRSKASLLSESEMHAMYESAAEWLYEKGNRFEAINYYCASNNYAVVWAIIRQNHQHAPSHSMASYYKEILADTPQQIILSDPHILLYAALVLINCRETAQALELLDHLNVQFEAGQLGRAVAGELYLLYGLAYFTRHMPEFEECWRKAHHLLDGNSTLIDNRLHITHITPLFSPNTLARQDVDALLQSFARGLPHFVAMTGGCGAGFLEATRAELLYYAGQFDQALLLFRQSMDKAAEAGQIDILLSGTFYIFQIGLYEGDYGECMRAISILQSYSLFNKQSGSPDTGADLTLMYLLSLLAPTQTVAKEHDLLRQEKLLSRGRYITSMMFTLMADPATLPRALTWLEDVRGNLLEDRLYFTLCYVLNLGSYVCLQLGQPAYAHLLLEEAYEYAGNGNYPTVFILEGQRTVETIQAYRQTSRTKIPATWLDEVARRAKKWSVNQAKMIAQHQNNTSAKTNH